MTRRQFVVTLSAALPALVTRSLGASEIRALTFNNVHTGERLNVDYFSGGTYVPDALAEINRLLRDFRTGDVHAIDTGLLDLLHRLNGATGSRRPYEVISGYRSPATNAMLRAKSESVAAGSLHMTGQAIDVRLADVSLTNLRQAALSLRGGGVGYYPTSNFVHLDVGLVRTW